MNCFFKKIKVNLKIKKMKILLEDELLQKIESTSMRISKKLNDPYLQSKLEEIHRHYRKLLAIQREALLQAYQELSKKKEKPIDYSAYDIRSITIQRDKILIESDKGAFALTKEGKMTDTESEQVLQLLIQFFQMNEDQKEQFFASMHRIIKHKLPLLKETVQKAQAQFAEKLNITQKALEIEWVVLHEKNQYVSKIKKETMEMLFELLK